MHQQGGMVAQLDEVRRAAYVCVGEERRGDLPPCAGLLRGRALTSVRRRALPLCAPQLRQMVSQQAKRQDSMEHTLQSLEQLLRQSRQGAPASARPRPT